MFNGVIYRTTNLINGKWYIGIDVNNDPKYLGDGIALRRDIKKYGRKKFRKEILCWALSLEELILLEQKMLGAYDADHSPCSYHTVPESEDTGFNRLAQAENSAARSARWHNLPEATKNSIRQRVSDAHSGVSLSPAHREKISQAKRGRANPKTATALREFWASEQGDVARGHLQTQCGRSGEQNGFFGRAHSELSKEKISSAKRGKANLKNRKLSASDVCLIQELVDSGVTRSALAVQFGVSKPTITRCLR